MSNDVCGYITPSLNREKEMLLLKYISSISMGDEASIVSLRLGRSSAEILIIQLFPLLANG